MIKAVDVINKLKTKIQDVVVQLLTEIDILCKVNKQKIQALKK